MKAAFGGYSLLLAFQLSLEVFLDAELLCFVISGMRILLVLQDRSMLSHINAKLSPRPFE